MKRSFIILGAVLGLIMAGAFLYSRLQNTTTDSDKVTIVGSFYPLAHFAEQVGGDRVKVTNITPAGSEPHDFEPSPRDIATIQSSRLFLMNGSGLDPWAENLQVDLAAKGIKVLKMSDIIELIENEEAAEHADEEHAEDEHEETATDPHFWLDPELAQKEVAAIAAALAKIDPAYADYYRENAEAFTQKLAALDDRYTAGLANCAKREIITSHAAFGYLAKRYNITVHAISGLSPEQEPSAQQMGELARLAREKNIRYIFFETLVNPRLAETVAQEVGAQTLVFNPIEGLTEQQIQAGENYISAMEENLTNLRTALECQ